MRAFDTGAKRDDDTGKLQYTQFLAPSVLRRYAEYLREHCTQADGQTRSGDNWKQGIPQDVYMASLLRHFMEFWEHEEVKLFQGLDSIPKAEEDLLCAIIFNAMGLLYEKITRPST